MISCSCARERACERGLYLRARSRNACTPLGCCRMICSAGPLVNMTSRYLSCASMSWFKGSLGIQTLACAASSAASIIRPSWRLTTDTYERNLKLQSLQVLSSPENTGGFPILVSMIPRPAGVVGGGTSAPSDGSTGGTVKSCSALSLWVSCRMLLCSVPNRRTSLKSVCTNSACLCRSASA